MKTTVYRIIILLLLITEYFIQAKGQENHDSLFRYIDIALKNNPLVQQKFYEYQASVERVRQTGTLPDPELSAGVFLKPMEIVTGLQYADLALMQMFPWFGVLKNAREETNLMSRAKYEAFRDAGEQISFEVRKTWYELYKIRKNISTVEKNIGILNTIEGLVLEKFRTGAGGGTMGSSAGMNMTAVSTSSAAQSAGSQGMQNMGGNMQSSSGAQPQMDSKPAGMPSTSPGTGLYDLYLIQIEAGNLQNSLDYLKDEERSVKSLFNTYLSRDPGSDVFTPDTLAAGPLPVTVTAIPDSITANNAMLSMLDYERQSYTYKKRMSELMGYPMFGLGLNYSVIGKSEMSGSSMNGGDMIMPMVRITIPVNRKKYSAMQKEASLLELAASNSYRNMYNNLQAEYYATMKMYNDAQRRVALYKNQYDLAGKSFELVLKNYSVNKSDLTEVLRIEQQILDYELKQNEAVADLNTAIAIFRRLMSLPPVR
ncbi:MAG: TolC family protein [Bacteroidales bacterium]